VFVSSTDTELHAIFDLNVDNGGAAINGYLLELYDDLLTAFVTVTNYDGVSNFYIFNDFTDSLITGQIMRIRISAINIIGTGTPSNELIVALTAVPNTPIAPTRIEVSSSKTAIGVDWTAVAGGTSPGGDIIGYRLYMATGSAGSFSLIYDGTSYPGITSRVISGLVTG
jgi:hypothetical protein